MVSAIMGLCRIESKLIQELQKCTENYGDNCCEDDVLGPAVMFNRKCLGLVTTKLKFEKLVVVNQWKRRGKKTLGRGKGRGKTLRVGEETWPGWSTG